MDLVSHLPDRLLFAVPKKGRLHQQCLDLLQGSDIQFTRNNRLDIALCLNLPVALIFLPAADIPRFVGEGNVDLGITGQDQVAEAGLDVEELIDLGFGKCKLQVQVPEKGEYQTAEQLIGKNVVTSFEGLVETYFRKLENKPTGPLATKIKYVGGSVEAACALGVADGIVDLVESGETMRAAGLKPIDTVLTTSAVLIASRTPSNPALVATITNRIRGVIAAKRYVLCNYNVSRANLAEAVKVTPGKRAPTVSPLEDGDWVAVSSMVEKKVLAQTMDRLQEIGATDILVFQISNSRVD
ncbi:ATP phosphoribosyltransferase (ATP-PRTase) (ATP-PRT) [Saitoella coloradoensis]